MPTKYRYDYYTVEVPDGVFTDTIEDLGLWAIAEAKERARLYVVPAEWRATHVSGALGEGAVMFRVTRKRRR